MPPLKTIFMGTAELACASLQALGREPFVQLVAVVSQPDKPKGRDLKVQPTPVKTIAHALGIPVLQPAKARDNTFIDQLRKFEPDLIVVAAYGQILPPAILELPRFGCLNVHTSLLPKHRGAAPIQWAILQGDVETGVTIMKMDAGLDTGDILTQTKTPISPTDNAQTLHDRLARLGSEVLVSTIPDYVAGRITPRPQPTEHASYARRLTKQDGKLDWTQPAGNLWNRIRAFTPWPGAYTFQRIEGKRQLLKIWSAQVDEPSSGQPGEVLRADKSAIVVACGEQALRILELQREGGRRLGASEFLAGHVIPPGTLLGP
jgi:methionyl-tRNA formyltransferase